LASSYRLYGGVITSYIPYPLRYTVPGLIAFDPASTPEGVALAELRYAALFTSNAFPIFLTVLLRKF